MYRKPGCLDSRDQLRSRFLHLSRSTFKNRHRVEIHFLFFFVQNFKIETFQSRLGHVEIFKIFKICRDILRLMRSTLFRLFEGTSGSKISTIWEISIEKIYWDLLEISCLGRFLHLDQDFWDWKVVLRQNQDFSISIVETSFWNCQDFLDCWDKSRPPGYVNFVT